MFETAPFQVHLPKNNLSPIVASIPHSGLVVPNEIVTTLNPKYQDYLPHQDWHLDRLYDGLPTLGITVLAATYSRYVVDLNRLAKAPFIGNFWQAAVPQKTAYGESLYKEQPSQQQIQARIDQVYTPYHQQLETLLNQTVKQFGCAYLLDLHSFGGPITDQVCLGNGNGKTCSDFFTAAVESAFVDTGYQVARNHMFNGGHITRHYGKVNQVESLQIELRYHNYLNLQQLDQPRIPDWDVPEFHQTKQNVPTIFKNLAKTLQSSRRLD